MWKWSWRKKWSKIIRRWVHLNGNSLWVRLCIWDIVFGGKKSSSRSAVWTNIDHLGPLKCINWTMFLILVVGDFSRFASVNSSETTSALLGFYTYFACIYNFTYNGLNKNIIHFKKYLQRIFRIPKKKKLEFSHYSNFGDHPWISRNVVSALLQSSYYLEIH